MSRYRVKNMHIIMVIFATILIIQSYAIAESNEQSSILLDSEAKEKKLTLPFTSTLQTELYQDNIKYYNFPTDYIYRPLQNKKCPLCDTSVLPYCGEKLLHDACCCTDPYTYDLPYQCKLADCRFLHANSCKEHQLIAICCCSDDYRSLLKNFSNV